MSKSLLRFLSSIFLVIFGLSSTGSLAAPNPSFPCSKRTSPDEKAICQDQRLTALDHIANQGYLFLRAKLGKAQANKINLPLIRQRQKCKADVICIEKAQRESIRIFNQNGARLEIPEPAADEAARSAQAAAPATQPATAPVTAPTGEPTPSSETAMTSSNPATASPEPAPSDETARLSETITPPEKAPKTPAVTEETAATATPAPPPSTTTPAPAPETKASETAGAPQEPVDQPPAESEGPTAANDNEPSQDAAGAVAEATPEPKGSREWRPELEKELRAESELESSATDALSEEMAELEQIKPLSRQQKEALVSTRSKHRTAFILAAILFALVVAYAISKFKRDPGVSVNTVKFSAVAVDPGTKITKTVSAPTAPLTAPRPSPVPGPVRETGAESAAGKRPTIATASVQQSPEAWVWTHYKGKI